MTQSIETPDLVGIWKVVALSCEPHHSKMERLAVFRNVAFSEKDNTEIIAMYIGSTPIVKHTKDELQAHLKTKTHPEGIPMKVLEDGIVALDTGVIPDMPSGKDNPYYKPPVVDPRIRLWGNTLCPK